MSRTKAKRQSPPPPESPEDDYLQRMIDSAGKLDRQIIDSLREGIIIYDRHLRIRLWNPFMERLTGLPAKHVVGMTPVEAIPVLAGVGLMPALEKVLAGEIPGPVEIPFHDPGSENLVWLSDVSSPLKNDRGEIIGVIGTIRDITDRKRDEVELVKARELLEERIAERTVELQKSHDLLTSLSRQVPGVIFQFLMQPDGTYRIPYASGAISELYGVDPEDVRTTAEPLLTNIHPEDYPIFLKVVNESARALTPASLEFRYNHPEYGTVWRLASARPQRLDDGSCLWHGYSDDITEQKRVDQELRESRSKLNQAQHVAKLGSWHWFADTNTLTWSEEMYTLTGSDPSLPPTPYLENPERYAPESWKRLDEAARHALATGEPYELELELIRTDGARRLAIARGEAIRNDQGRVTQLHGTLQDVTEQRQLEHQLSQARVLESIGQLAAGVAHEVRNPLNAILSITEALFREYEFESNSEFQPYITHIRTQVNRLARLMNELLDLGKPIPTAHMQMLPLFDLCRETADLWKSSGSAPNRRVVLSTDDRGNGAWVFADGIKLQQVFFNLLENAGYHSPVGSIIRFTLSTTENESVIRIIDRGNGIPTDKIARIYEPFFSNRRGGTGLGLALVKHFVEHMGGSVRIFNNHPEPGCTAEIRLPPGEEGYP